MTRRLMLALGTIATLATGPVLAHHAWPVDETRMVTVTGTVTGYEWKTPHMMIGLEVKAQDGSIEKWSVGGSSPTPPGRKGVGQEHAQGRRRHHCHRLPLPRRSNASCRAPTDRDGQRQGDARLRPEETDAVTGTRSCAVVLFADLFGDALGPMAQGSRTLPSHVTRRAGYRTDAPPPRTPDGRPDLSGNWLRADPRTASLGTRRTLLAESTATPAGTSSVEPQVPTFPPNPKYSARGRVLGYRDQRARWSAPDAVGRRAEEGSGWRAR